MMTTTGAKAPTVLRILLVEDNEHDAELLVTSIEAGGYSVTCERVQAADALRDALSTQTWDVVLSDYNLPAFQAPDALAIVRQLDAHLPFIIVSGTVGEEMAVRALKDGADDFLNKGNLARLIPAIERELREVEIRRSMRHMETRAAYALDAAGVGIWEFDLIRGELQWSQDVSVMFGLPLTLSRGGLDVFQRAVHADDWPMIVDALRDAREQDVPYRIDFRVVHADETTHWIHAKGRVTRSVDGEPMSMLGIVLDVTERKQLEEQLRQSQKLDSIGRLAGGIAHDFNNILTAILGYTEMTLDQIGPDKPISNDLREIRAASDRAVALVRQLLAFSRKQALHPVALDVNDVVANMRDMLDRLIGDQIHISTALEPDLPLMLGDRVQLEQVLMNLVVNARDAMPNGGVITIATTSVSPQERLNQGASPASSRHIQIKVIDTGVGMSAATQAQMFEPFFTTKGVGQGTGLGLSTVYGVVQQLKGQITVRSREGAGTTFTLSFPQMNATVASRAASPQPHRGLTIADQRYHVLVVEDQAGVRQLVSRILTRHGYTVLEASGPAEAREVFKQHGETIDLLITDVVMPDTRGPELAAELCHMRSSMRVLFMSGYAGEDLESHDDLVGQCGVLEKPFTASALLDATQHALLCDTPDIVKL
jgi:two-component system cell cycle sensor histidine kinase/response regulator CckA